MNSDIKLSLARSLSAIGVFSLIEKSLHNRGSLIFTLHRVLPLEEMDECYNANLALTPDSFDAFLRFLKKRLPIVPLAELVEQSSRGRGRPVCSLTFDDGWEDNYRVALPIIKSHDVPVTIFIPTDLIGGQVLLPEERFWQAWHGPTHDKCVEIMYEELARRGIIASDAKPRPYLPSRVLYKQLPHDIKIAMISRIEAYFTADRQYKTRFLDWDQIRTMRDQGIEFGSHTMAHRLLSRESKETIYNEVLGSKLKIESELQTACDFFSYPNGMYKQEAVEAVRDAGYLGAVTTERGPITSSASPFLIPRIPLSNDMVNTRKQTFSRALAELLIVQTYVQQPECASAVPKSPILRRVIKALVYGIALILVSPFAGVERLMRMFFKRDVFFSSHAEIFSLVPAKAGRYIRNAYYHLTLRRCPLNCCFLMGVTFTHSEAEVGNRVYVGAYSIIGMADIGDDAMLSDHVYVLSGRHQHGTSDLSVPFQRQARTFSRVAIGANSWLGVNAVVMADVGKSCVVGAASVVTRNIPDYSVAVGSPARVIKSTLIKAKPSKMSPPDLSVPTSG